MKLHYKSFGPINTMASLHADNCKHLKFAVKGSGIRIIDVSGPDDEIVKDLEQRNYPVRLAPCLKKNEDNMKLKKLLPEILNEDKAFQVGEHPAYDLKDAGYWVQEEIDQFLEEKDLNLVRDNNGHVIYEVVVSVKFRKH